MSSVREVERALVAAGRAERLQPGVWFCRNDLLEAFLAVGFGGVAGQRAYVALRRAARSGRLVGGVEVEVDGPRHALRFRFWSLPGPDGAPRLPRPPRPQAGVQLDLHLGDNLAVAASLEPAGFDLVYLDPPFNTGRVRRGGRQRVEAGEGRRTGFRGRSVELRGEAGGSYVDAFDDYLGFLEPRLRAVHRLLSPTGSLFVHLDWREVHYVKVMLDSIFGRRCFMNQIIWAYDFGARSRSRWSAKHDTLLWYVRDPGRYTFDHGAMDRIPYMAPGLVGPEKAARGKTPTDVWWHTIVPTSGPERTGYPDQKPLGVLRRIVAVHSRPGDRVLDLFAGSGTTGAAAVELGRSAVLVDNNPEALAVMEERLRAAAPRVHRAPSSPDPDPAE